MVALMVSGATFYGIRLLGILSSEQREELWQRFARTQSRLFSKALSPSAIGFYTVFSMAWYMYTGLGGKFKTLPNHVADGINSILYGESGGGAAAVRSATKDYGSTSVAISRWLYILLGALMALGVALVLLRRVVDDERLVSDEFLALGTGFLAMLGAAFLPFSSGFNAARVMMIIFTFSAPFAVLGLRLVLEFASNWIGAIDMDEKASFVAPVSIAVILTVFLLLNAGVVSATITDDYAPSNTLLQQQLLNSDDPVEQLKAGMCTPCGVQTHAWVWNHRNPNASLYGDFHTAGQVDYVKGRITEYTDTVPKGSTYKTLWDARNGTNTSAYLVVLPHNFKTDVAFVGSKYTYEPIDPLQGTFRDSNRVYHSKGAVVYKTTDDTTSTDDINSSSIVRTR